MVMKQKTYVLRCLMVCLILSVIGACLAGCSDQLLEEGSTTESVSEKVTTDKEGFVVGDDVDPLAFMEDAEHTLYAEFLKTGKSDSILLRMDDTVILVDTGDSDDYAAIQSKLDGYGIDTIDYLIITHYDNDHIGSADRVLEQYTVKTVYAPDYVRVSYAYDHLMDAVDHVVSRTSFLKITEDVELDLGYGTLWINTPKLYENGKVLGSDQNNGTVEENNYSLVTEVTFGRASLLLTGDAEEERMMEWKSAFETRYAGTIKNYTLMKLPHHGSHDAGIHAVLQAVMPRYGVVCSDEKTVETLLDTSVKSVGAALYHTYNGTVLFATDGSSWTVQQ